MEARLPANHPGTANMQWRLGEALLAAGDKEGAKKALSKAADIVAIAYGEDHPTNKAIHSELKKAT